MPDDVFTYVGWDDSIWGWGSSGWDGFLFTNVDPSTAATWANVDPSSSTTWTNVDPASSTTWS